MEEPFLLRSIHPSQWNIEDRDRIIGIITSHGIDALRYLLNLMQHEATDAAVQEMGCHLLAGMPSTTVEAS
jgi:hypothetical protein